MATIGNIVANLAVNSDAWNKGFRKSETTLQRFSRNAVNGLKTATAAVTAFTAATAAMAAYKITNGIKEQFTAIDKLAKTSDKLGIATDALAGLRHAAELTGAGTEVLDKGIEKMLINVSKAADGTGAAKDALWELGLTAEALAQQSPADQFSTIADALNKVENNTDKVRIAYEVFGKSGTSLINTLKLGSDGLKEVAKDADKLGLSVSRFDAAKIEAANDAWYRMQTAVTGLSTQMTVELAPAIKVASDYMTEWLAGGTQGIKNMSSQTSGWTQGFGTFLDLLQMINSAWHALQSSVTKGISDILYFYQGIGMAADAVSKAMTGASLGIADTIGEIRTDLDRLATDQWQKAGAIYNDEWWSNSFTKKYNAAIAEAEATAKAASDNIANTLEGNFNNLDLTGLKDSLQLMSSGVMDWFSDAWNGLIDDANEKANESTPESPRSLMRDSAEMFRAINTQYGRDQNEIPKQQLSEQQKTNTLLNELIEVSAPQVFQFLGLGA